VTLDADALTALAQAARSAIPFVDRSEVEIVELARGRCRLRMPLEGNGNHIGTMYAGALFTLAEVPGGLLFLATFDVARYYPIVTAMTIDFLRPATTDITVDVSMSDDEITRIEVEAATSGKARYAWDCDLVDAAGEVVARTHNEYQLRSHAQPIDLPG
jgi:thioesterase domain-containing protein